MRKVVNPRTLPVLRPVLAVGLVLAAGSYSFGVDNDRMVVLGRTSQPIGHYNYCLEHPEDCISNAASPLAPELTKEKVVSPVNSPPTG